MPDVTLIGLGFQGDADNRFQSTNPNQAPGSDAFYACVLVNLQESLLVAPVEASYFGNFAADIGWDIGRDQDTPASDPPNTPEIITLRARFGLGGATTTLAYSADASSMFGRTHLIAISVEGLVATLYVNGAAVAQETLASALTLGNTGLTYGNVAGGGLRSGDPIIAAAYSDSDAADFITNQRALFEGIRSSGKLTSTIAALGLSAEYIYESFQQKAPISGTPTVPLKNFGSLGANGNLIFAGSVALVVTADPDPDYTGGAQSSTVGPGAVNLQDAYNAGPTGLIVTGAPGPFGVDDIRIEDASISTPDSAAVPTLEITAGADTAGATGGVVAIDGGASAVVGGIGGAVLVTGGVGEEDGGAVTLTGGAGTSGAGGGANLIGGSGPTAGGAAIVAGGDGALPGEVSIEGGDSPGGSDGGRVHILGGLSTDNAGGNVEIEAAPTSAPTLVGGSILAIAGSGGPDAGAAAGNGGQVIIRSGLGGTGTGPGATAGNGGELNIEAGTAGPVVGGAAPGVGGLLNLSGGNGVTGTGGDVTLRGGNGDVLTGAVTIVGGTGPGLINPVAILGGSPTGLASGPGGSVQIAGGDAANGAGQDGGNIVIDGGIGDGATGNGGSVTITGGTTDAGGPGGTVALVGGAGGTGIIDNGGAGGNATIAGGNATQANQPAGEVQIDGGNATGAGAPALGGNVLISAGGSTGSTGGEIVIRSGNGPTEITAGNLQLAIGTSSGGPAATVGGFYIDSGDGRMSLRTYSIGGVDTGALKVHEVNINGQALQSAAQQGLVIFQTEQAVSPETTIGFRGSKSGNWGMFGRVYQQTFNDSNLVGDVLTVTHNLDTNAPIYAVYEPGGQKSFESVTQITGVQYTSSDVLEISFTSGYVVGAGWYVTVLGI